MEVTRDLCNLNLLVRLMLLLRQTLFNLVIGTTAGAILMRISAEQVPSLHRVAPRYLKLVTSSNFWPVMLCTVCVVGHDLTLFCADSHSICICSVYESAGEVLKFTTAATQD